MEFHREGFHLLQVFPRNPVVIQSGLLTLIAPDVFFKKMKNWPEHGYGGYGDYRDLGLISVCRASKERDSKANGDTRCFKVS